MGSAFYMFPKTWVGGRGCALLSGLILQEKTFVNCFFMRVNKKLTRVLQILWCPGMFPG